MKYNFDQMINRHGTVSMKWDAGQIMKEWGLTERFDEDTLPLMTADMDFRCAQPIIDAMEKVVQHGIFGYSTPYASGEYATAVQRWFRERHGWEIPSDAIVCGNGVLETLTLAIRAYTKPGDGIMLTRPVYGPFTEIIEDEKRKVVNSQLSCTNGYYTMDFDDIEEKAKDPSVTMFLLCSPHNPVGRVWKEEELRRLAEICEKNGLLLVSDEIHCDILRKEISFTTAGKIGSPSNTIVLSAISKTFNCAGLQCSQVIIADPGLRAKYEQESGAYALTPFAIAATIGAYTQGDEWLDQLLEYMDETIDWVLQFIQKNLPGVSVWRPEGTYILWMDFRGTGLSPEEIHDRIYHKANVCLESGEFFDPEQGKGFERICLPSPRPMIQEAFRRIAEQFQDIRSTN